MFGALRLTDLELAPQLADTMFSARASQFVARHKWPLTLQDGRREVDEFDDGRTLYCVVQHAGVHQASLRLRPETAGSMVERHFPTLWAPARERLEGSQEITRFCCSPDLSAHHRISAVSDLLLGLCRHAQATGASRLFGIVFPSVARVIKQAGWPGEVLGRAEDPSGPLLLIEWVPSDLVAWNIQERREFREEQWRRRQVRSGELELAA